MVSIRAGQVLLLMHRARGGFMHRPAGVVILSSFFACVAGLIAALLAAELWRLGISKFLTHPEEVVGALAMSLGLFFFSLLSYGLWDLDEDTRWAVFAFFAWPAILGIIGFAVEFTAWDLQAAMMLATITLLAAPPIYLQLRPVRSCFVQLIVLDLSR